MQCDHNHGSCIVHVPLFDGLSDEEVHLLSEAVHSRHYRKGEFVFQEGERSDALYVVNQGVVKVVKLADNGKEHVIRFLFHGDFGGMSALFKEGLHYANAEVVEDAVVCRIYRQDLKSILNNNSNMAYRFLAAISDRLRDADEWSGTISLFDAERRLAKMLLIFTAKMASSNPGSNPYELPVSKRDLAALIGITPETLSRKLAVFESEGYISMRGKKDIEILNSSALEEIAGVQQY